MQTNTLIHSNQGALCQRGFTLIELMIAIVVVSILTAVAVPSYRQYAITNTEAQTQAEMRQIAIDLNRWRASALSYQGFEPKIGVNDDGKGVYGYADAAKTFIYLPKGSTAANYNYKLTIVDGVNTAQSLRPNLNQINTATGRTWRMYARPNPDRFTANADAILMTSNGLSCQNSSANRLTLNSNDCGIGGETW